MAHLTPMVQEPSTPSALLPLMHGAAKGCIEPILTKLRMSLLEQIDRSVRAFLT
jgi:hypothetical protein